MNGKMAKLFSLALSACKIISMVTFLMLTSVIVFGALKRPYGLEGIYNTCAPYEMHGPIEEYKGDQSVVILSGEAWSRLSKMEVLRSLFGTWAIAGSVLVAFWLHGRKTRMGSGLTILHPSR